MRWVAAVVAMASSSGCRAPQPTQNEQTMTPTSSVTNAPVASTSTDAAGTQRTGAVLFCAYGGQGVVPSGAKPEAYYRVVVLFEVTTPDDRPSETLPLTSLVLEDAAGNPLARMRVPISAERAPRVALTDAWRSALDDHGPRFDDRYAPGVTRVRVEAWLETKPAAPPARVRVVLAGAGAPIELSGPVAGEWPTG